MYHTHCLSAWLVIVPSQRPLPPSTHTHTHTRTHTHTHSHTHTHTHTTHTHRHITHTHTHTHTQFVYPRSERQLYKLTSYHAINCYLCPVHIRSYLTSVINARYVSPGHACKHVKIRGYFSKPEYAREQNSLGDPGMVYWHGFWKLLWPIFLYCLYTRLRVWRKSWQPESKYYCLAENSKFVTLLFITSVFDCNIVFVK